MRLVFLAETPSMPTGFGQQTRMLLEGLTKRGHEIFLLSAAVPMKPIPIEGVTEWRYANIHDVDLLDTVIHGLQPNAVFIFGCTSTVIQYLHLRSPFGNCPAYFWLPYEGSILPRDSDKNFRGVPKDRAVHLSNFARKLWTDVCPSTHVIPHGVDTSLFSYQPETDRTELRAKWSERLRYPLFPDSLVVFNCDRNIWHKRWDATFDFCNRLQARYPEKRITLLAHTRIRQDTEKGHPPGYDLRYLEKVYGFDRVAYTMFDWGNSLKREDIAELMRLSDLRLTTSMGEGFGVPTIESAAVGLPQIVNNQTTMPELLGEDSLSLVEAATLEDKMGSLWPVPNVTGMVERACQFIDDPQVAADTAEQARLRVEGLFDADTVCDQFHELFTQSAETISPDVLWLRHRWGWRKDAVTTHNLEDVARVCSKLKHRPAVLEIGSWDGRFVETCAEFNMDVVGIEADATVVERQPPRAKMYMTCQPYLDDWPHADAVVMTDMGEALLKLGGGEMNLLQQVLERITYYEWAMLRFRPCFMWGVPLLRPETMRAVLTANGMHRRTDIEQIARGKFKNFEHEVWRRGTEVTTDIPPLLVE